MNSTWPSPAWTYKRWHIEMRAIMVKQDLAIILQLWLFWGPKRWNKSWIPHKVIWSTRETTHEYHKLMSKPNLQVFAHVSYLKQQYTACSLQRQYHQLYISKESVLFMSKASFCKANFKPNIPLPNPATAFTIWQTHAKKQNWSKTNPYW